MRHSMKAVSWRRSRTGWCLIGRWTVRQPLPGRGLQEQGESDHRNGGEGVRQSAG